jgi:uncharacterized protein YdbL (DUF1318 family)
MNHSIAPLHPARSFVGILFACGITGFVFTGCAPKVQLTTPEPLKVDISMTVDIYQRQVPGTERKTTEEEVKALRSREERATEIWTMKNDAVAVEGETGYLEARPKSGWDADYVTNLVAAENRDRRILYEAEAQESGKPLKQVQEEAGRRLREQAYTGGGTNQTTRTPSVPVPPVQVIPE